SIEQASENYRSLGSYTQVVSLPADLLLVFGRGRKRPIYESDQIALEISLDLYGSVVRVHLSAETVEHVDEFRIDQIEINERFTHRSLWTCQVDRDGEKRIWDHRRRETEFTKTMLTPAELRGFEWPMPAFGEYDDLLHRLRSLLRSERFGEVV